MSLKSARKKLESEFGAIPEDAWISLLRFWSEIDDEEDDEAIEGFIETAHQALDVAQKFALVNNPAGSKPSPKTPGRKLGWSGYYSKSFDERHNLYVFLITEEAKIAEAHLMGEEIPLPSTSAELYERYKSTPDPMMWGEPRTHVPKTLPAFEKACQRARQEFGNLTEEDQSDWFVQNFLNTWDNVNALRNGTTKRLAASRLSDGFQVLRNKRAGTQPEWRGKLDRWAVYDLLEQLLKYATIGEKQIRSHNEEHQDRAEPPLDLSAVYEALDNKASPATVMLSYGQAMDWSQLRFRPGVVIHAGEESWREFFSRMSPADQERAELIAFAISEERRLIAAYRDKQAAKAETATQDDPQTRK